MTYQEFVQEVNTSVLPKRHSCIRKGQALMNRLFEVRPDLYNHITVSSIEGSNYVDCFYVDSVMPKTLEWLSDNWSKDFTEKNIADTILKNI